MKTIKFATTLSDLLVIIKSAERKDFNMQIINRTSCRDVLVKVSGQEQDIYDLVNKNDLNKCI